VDLEGSADQSILPGKMSTDESKKQHAAFPAPAAQAWSDNPQDPDCKAKLDEMARLVEDCRSTRHGDDFVLCRFLRAEKGNVETAAKRYRVTQEWRKEVCADDMLNGP